MSKIASGATDYASNFDYNGAGAITGMQLGRYLHEGAQFNPRLQVSALAVCKDGPCSTPLQPSSRNLLTLQLGYLPKKADGSLDTAKNNGNIHSQTISGPISREE